MELGGTSSSATSVFLGVHDVKDNRTSPHQGGPDGLCHVQTEAPLAACSSLGLVEESHEGVSVSGQDEKEPLTFSCLSSYVSSIQLPGTSWATQVVDSFGVEAVVFTEVALAKKRDQAPFLRKSLDATVSSSGMLSLRAFIYGHPITVNAISGDVVP
ncbi:uncharacterized protein LOC142586140 [Dermacentor variabilis]|uniref:uncharacterized protein LOC142586140 n=1 Tax=Dermacentor variabilis TaxID=34621 RepID=UPI003F5BF784